MGTPPSTWSTRSAQAIHQLSSIPERLTAAMYCQPVVNNGSTPGAARALLEGLFRGEKGKIMSWNIMKCGEMTLHGSWTIMDLQKMTLVVDVHHLNDNVFFPMKVIKFCCTPSRGPFRGYFAVIFLGDSQHSVNQHSFGCPEWYWLVVWNIFIFPFILGMSSSLNWRTHIFQRGEPTTNQDSKPTIVRHFMFLGVQNWWGGCPWW